VHVKLKATQFMNRETGEPGRTRIGFLAFKQLQDVLKENAKKLTIQMDVADLTESQVLAMQDVFSNHSGDHILNFVVYEMKNKIKIHMPSKTKKVNICTELISELEQNKISYKLN
jgi:DNA polymerase-3 subunit alpha